MIGSAIQVFHQGGIFPTYEYSGMMILLIKQSFCMHINLASPFQLFFLFCFLSEIFWTKLKFQDKNKHLEDDHPTLWLRTSEDRAARIN
jgi:hypothetical protein